jgi:ribosomal protein S18 acetylase RimI-like enzyme
MLSGVEVRSLGYRTDLMVRVREGSQVEDRGDYLVLHSPDNPGYWWGNFLLVPSLGPGEASAWLARFAAEFPRARHVTFGVDVTDDSGMVGDELAAAGFTAQRLVVLTAGGLRPPPFPNTEATCRPLAGDADWEQSAWLREIALIDEDGVGNDPEFVRSRVAAARALTEAGLATWYGAFIGGELLAQMGIATDAPSRLARYQSVETRPDARRRGLAGTLTWHVGTRTLAAGEARTLVIVADPGDVAIRVYRSLGFTDAEYQIGFERPPADNPDGEGTE